MALFLYNPDNEPSRCAFRSITEANYLNQTTSVFVADVSQVRDIHPVYQITSVASLLLFESGKLVNVIKGCHDSEFLQRFFRPERAFQ